MERGVEYAYLRHIGHECCDGFDTGHVGRIVEGSEVVALADHVLHFVGDYHALGELLGAVYHAMAYGINLVIALDAAFVGIGEHVEDGLDRTLVVGESEFENGFGSVLAFVFEEPVGKADLLNSAFGESLLGGSVDELVFYRAAARIYYEDFHDWSYSELFLL